MPTIGQTLTTRAGPLPIWGWAGLGTIGAIVYMKHRQSTQAAAAAAQQTNSQGVGASNLGTVPLSNLTADAQPMPIQMGDTFVNVPPPNVTQTATQTNAPVVQPGPTGPLPTPSPVNTKAKTFSLPGGYTLQAGGSKGSIDILKGGKYVSGGFIPSSGRKPLAGTPFSFQAAGDKALGAVDIFQGNKFIGAFQT